MQQLVTKHFDAEASRWRDLYWQTDVFSVIAQHRRAVALAWVHRLAPPPSSRVLEVGCGAGLTATALAQRGLVVDATDGAAAMVALTRQRAAESGVDRRLTVSLGDAHALQFDGGTFRVVVALGLIPWLHSPRQALQEMMRVLQPGGHLIISAGNRSKLNYLFDPLLSPVLTPLKSPVKNALRRYGLRQSSIGGATRPTLYSRSEFESLVESARLERLDGSAFGFGPFTLLGRKLLPDRLGIAVHQRLQRLADQGVPGFRSTAWENMILARKAGG